MASLCLCALALGSVGLRLEAAVRAYLAQMIRDEQNARDLAIINRRADYLNQEAVDVLAYQVRL